MKPLDQPKTQPNLADRSALKSHLQDHHLWAKKSLGQHFLVDERVLDRIIEAAELHDDDTVVEVGPGPGVLSQRLIQRCARLIALELDEDYIAPWQELFRAEDNAEIVHQDVLHYRPPEDAYKVVANIPYYISSPILSHFLRQPMRRRPKRMVILVQREVAQRICDPKKPSLLSWQVKVFADASIACSVPPGSFFPPPKVHSSVLALSCREQPLLEDADIDPFFQLLEKAYTQPRKTLLNNLSASSQLDRDEVRSRCEEAGIDPMKRPHQLVLQQWLDLMTTFSTGS